MSESRAQLERGLFEELRSGLGAALEGMTGQAPALSGDPLPSPPATATLRWRQPLGSLPGAVWILASEADWKAAGLAVLQAAGIEDSNDAELKSTYFEIVNQGLPGFGRALTKRLGREITASGGKESGDPPPATRWAEVHVKVGELAFTLVVGIEEVLLQAVEAGIEAAVAPPVSRVTDLTMAPAAAAPPQGSGSKTFELLLEVELPVSVSFGRANIPLKDVLKLSTGSIVELNRAVVEPVEIIVNNCVIARGEVVVVEGNFGVRIQEVVSRQERLRTLQ